MPCFHIDRVLHAGFSPVIPVLTGMVSRDGLVLDIINLCHHVQSVKRYVTVCCFFICCQERCQLQTVKLFPESTTKVREPGVEFCAAFACKPGCRIFDAPLGALKLCTPYTAAVVKALSSSETLKEAIGKIQRKKYGGQCA